jgi:hypothetical protein
MRGLILATISLFSLGAVAAPAACMTSADAKRVAGNFQTLIDSTFNVTLAKTALSADYTDYSDSVNELINNGCPNGPAAVSSNYISVVEIVMLIPDSSALQRSPLARPSSPARVASPRSRSRS